MPAEERDPNDEGAGGLETSAELRRLPAESTSTRYDLPPPTGADRGPSRLTLAVAVVVFAVVGLVIYVVVSVV